MALVILVGIPGSGKSTFAASLNIPIINPDSIREELTGDITNQSRNKEVFEIAHKRLEELLLSSTSSDVIFDATNVKPSSRADLLRIAKKLAELPIAIRVTTPHYISLERNADRKRVVPGDVMHKMITNFDNYSTKEQLEAEGWLVIERDLSGS